MGNKHRTSARANECRKLQLERGKQFAIEAKPYLLDFLAKLGQPVPHSEANILRVHQAYQRLYVVIRSQLGFNETAHVGHHYWLWANGMPMDFLRTLTRKQAAAIRLPLEAKAKVKNQCKAGVAA